MEPSTKKSRTSASNCDTSPKNSSDKENAPHKSAIIIATEIFVKKELANQDGSHDWHHIHRVRNLALKLAEEEKITNLEVVELAALLHDIKDWKYSGVDNAGELAARDFLTKHGYPADKVELISSIIKNVGFKNELGGIQANITPELAVVQDADRIDAIGAIGIARAFTFGGTRNRALYDPEVPFVENLTQEQYKNLKNSPTVNHFYEKLLKLKDMIKTKSGLVRAEGRHKYMLAYLEQFYQEWDGNA